jgi:hypothetical protein
MYRNVSECKNEKFKKANCILHGVVVGICEITDNAT